MLNYLSYFYHYLLHPGLRDYVDKGIGIASRYKRCRDYWDDHLVRSREFQKVCLGNDPARCIGILGSGRLYDTDLPELRASSEKVVLYDADPSAVAYARRKLVKTGRDDECRILELTGVIEGWTKGLRQLLRKQPPDKEVAFFISQLSPRTDVLGQEAFDVVVSLNLLSQIALFWRDRVDALIPSPHPDVSHALAISCRKLQEAHLELLKISSGSRIILISDILFHYYGGDAPESEAAITVNPEENMMKDHWSLERTECWMWHIVPKGVEETEYGVLHEVRAWSWKRRSAACSSV